MKTSDYRIDISLAFLLAAAPIKNAKVSTDRRRKPLTEITSPAVRPLRAHQGD